MIQDLIKSVPSYREFLTIDELYQSDRELAQKHPSIVRLRKIGASKNGAPIQALKIGEGRYQAVLFGFPHPEEPSGSLVLNYLSEKLAADGDLRKRFDYTWHIVKCADPDGARLNEAWFKKFSVKNFALNYYRPPSHKQVEWSFPVKYRGYEWNSPISETKALMNLIDKTKPDFISSLHMAGFGGVYFYVSDDYPSLFKKYYETVKAEGLPLHLGEPEVPYRVKLAEAVFKMPSFEDSYDYYMKQLGKVPEELKRGTSSYGYARNISNPFTLVNEVPFLFHEKAADITPTETDRKQSKLEEIGRRETVYRIIQNQFKTTEGDLDKTSPFYEAVSEYLKRTHHTLAAEKKWIETDPTIRRKATEAEIFDSTIGVILDALCNYGVFIRLLNASPPRTAKKSTISRCLEEVKGGFDEAYEEFEKRAKYKIIPIQKLVRVQLGSLLHSADYLRQVRIKR